MCSESTDIIDRLQLQPHPEGGHFRRVYASAAQVQVGGRARPALTAIEYLLESGQVSQWHRIDAEECWHWQGGGALELRTYDPATARSLTTVLGSGDQAMHVVPTGVWQSARPLDGWCLVACTVSPGFEWEGFELLQPGSEWAGILTAVPAAQG